MLVLVQDDSVRQVVLKEVSLLLLRSETNLKAILDIPNWQLLFIPLLQTVPRSEALRLVLCLLFYFFGFGLPKQFTHFPLNVERPNNELCTNTCLIC